MCYKILFLHRNIDSIIFKPFTMYLNFDNPAQLKNQIEVLQPTTGICIFIDICGSTAIKRNRLKEWFLLIGNTIRFCAGISPLFRINVIKLIGDEIMIFIPDDKMETSNENYASILGLFDNLKMFLPTYISTSFIDYYSNGDSTIFIKSLITTFVAIAILAFLSVKIFSNQEIER